MSLCLFFLQTVVFIFSQSLIIKTFRIGRLLVLSSSYGNCMLLWNEFSLEKNIFNSTILEVSKQPSEFRLVFGIANPNAGYEEVEDSFFQLPEHCFSPFDKGGKTFLWPYTFFISASLQSVLLSLLYDYIKNSFALYPFKSFVADYKNLFKFYSFSMPSLQTVNFQRKLTI